MIIGTLIAVAFFGIMFLAVAMGYRSMEEEKQKQKNVSTFLIPESNFFQSMKRNTNNRMKQSPISEEETDDLVTELENFLRHEEVLAAGFIERPNIANLHKTGKAAPWNN